MYVDSHFRTNDSASNSDFGFELKEAFGLPDNAACYVDDISIPHTWRTVESHNNKIYIVFNTRYLSGNEMAYNWEALILTIPEGNYNGMTFASAIQEVLSFAVTYEFEVVYNTARGTITIKATSSEGINYDNACIIPNDFGIMSWLGNNHDYPWTTLGGTPQLIGANNRQSINGVLRNANNDFAPVNLQPGVYRTYESGFLDLLSIRNIYMHCPNLDQFNSIGVRGENNVIKKYMYQAALVI